MIITYLSSYRRPSSDIINKHYCGLLLKWNYTSQHVDVSMPKYVSKFLTKQGHAKTIIPQHAPHKWSVPIYGKKVQYAKLQDQSPKLDKKDTKNMQSIAGSMLHYGRAVDYSILPTINEISGSQTNPTKFTREKLRCY